jgi:ADP-heptose:LPS heptosyltransferase
LRILFVTAGRIGDAVLSTGILAHLAATHPKARFWVACGPGPAPLLAAAPFVERVLPMVKRRRAGHWRDLWRETVPHWWHTVVDLRGSGLAWLLPTLRRRVLRSSWEPKHRLLHLASALGLAQPLAPVLWTTPADEAEAERLIPPGPPVLALGPTANWGPKCWPAERFAAVTARLTAADGILPAARVAVVGTESEREMAQPVLDSVPPERRLDLLGCASLTVIHAALKRCALYVGNDSGMMHIAAASGVPTLGLFGPSSEVFYSPWGPDCAAVRGRRSFEDICWAPDFDHRSRDCMMLDLDAGKVVVAAEDLFRRAGQRTKT